MLSRWSLPIEFEQALQYADAALFVPPDDDDAAIPTRFDRKSFLQLSLKKAYTVLSHLGALRLPDHSILFPATPEGAEELPFDPIWLTTAGLVGASWHTNVLAALASVLSTSSFLTTCHRQARARPCSPGAFYPDIDATFLRSPTVLKALQSGNFAGGRELPTDQWQTELTPYHFIVSIPGQKVMALPISGFTASQMGTLVTNMGWILHRVFSDPGLYPNLPADCFPLILGESGHASNLQFSAVVCQAPR